MGQEVGQYCVRIYGGGGACDINRYQELIGCVYGAHDGGRPNALSNHAIPAEQGFAADNGGIGVLVVSDKPVSTFPDQTTYPTAGTQDAMISTSGEEEPLNIEDRGKT